MNLNEIKERTILGNALTRAIAYSASPVTLVISLMLAVKIEWFSNSTFGIALFGLSLILGLLMETIYSIVSQIASNSGNKFKLWISRGKWKHSFPELLVIHKYKLSDASSINFLKNSPENSKKYLHLLTNSPTYQIALTESNIFRNMLISAAISQIAFLVFLITNFRIADMNDIKLNEGYGCVISILIIGYLRRETILKERKYGIGKELKKDDLR